MKRGKRNVVKATTENKAERKQNILHIIACAIFFIAGLLMTTPVEGKVIEEVPYWENLEVDHISDVLVIEDVEDLFNLSAGEIELIERACVSNTTVFEKALDGSIEDAFKQELLTRYYNLEEEGLEVYLQRAYPEVEDAQNRYFVEVTVVYKYFDEETQETVERAGSTIFELARPAEEEKEEIVPSAPVRGTNISPVENEPSISPDEGKKGDPSVVPSGKINAHQEVVTDNGSHEAVEENEAVTGTVEGEAVIAVNENVEHVSTSEGDRIHTTPSNESAPEDHNSDDPQSEPTNSGTSYGTIIILNGDDDPTVLFGDGEGRLVVEADEISFEVTADGNVDCGDLGTYVQ